MHPLLLGFLFSLAYHVVVVPISIAEFSSLEARGVRNPIFTFSVFALAPGLILSQLLPAPLLQPLFDALRSLLPDGADRVVVAVPNFFFVWAAVTLVLWLIRRSDQAAVGK